MITDVYAFVQNKDFFNACIVELDKRMDNAENQKIIEDFITSMGATPVIYPMRNECCGGYVTMEDKALATKKSEAVLSSAKEASADMLITACPLCLYNLNKNNSKSDLPVFYFTELLAAALGHPDAMKEGK